MTHGPHLSIVVRLAHRIARAVVSPTIWRMVDDELREELSHRYAQTRSAWRTDLWGTAQYLSIAARLGAERVTSMRMRPRRTVRTLGSGWWLDVKHAVRAVRSSPGTSVTVVATVALAVGATTAVYSVVEGVLLRPLPFPEPERLARVWQTQPDWRGSPNASLRSAADRLNPNAPSYYGWLEADTGFETLGAYVDASFVLQGSDGADVVRGQEATSQLFEALRVEPILGRGLQPADDVAGATPVVVLSEAFWSRHFSRRPNVLGVDLILNATPHIVVGVMPVGFQGPSTEVLGPLLPEGAPLLWTPLTEEARRGWKSVAVVGRLRADVSLPVAWDRLALVQAQLAATYPEREHGRSVRVASLLDSIVGGVRSTLWFLLGAVALVLVVAIVNIANVLTAQGLSRRRDLAVRAALGAGSSRLVRGLFLESGVMTILGGVGGIAIAWIGLPVLLRFLPPAVPRLTEIGMSLGVFLSGIAVTGATALMVGTLPAMMASRADPQDAMRASSRSLTAGRAAGVTRSVLVVTQVSLAFVLLVGAGLLATSYLRLWSVERGFDTSGLVAMHVVPDRTTHPTREAYTRFVRELRERLHVLPGVRASAVNNLPLSGLRSETDVYLERPGEESRQVDALVSVGLPDYLTVMGIPLVAGRGFLPSDAGAAPAVAIVNETMARRYWPRDPPIGSRIRLDDSAWIEIVGVAADVRHQGLATRADPKVYLPAAQSRRVTNEWVLRIDSDVPSAIERAREAVAKVSPATPVTRVLVLDDTIADSVAIPRFRTLLVAGLAGLAAVLALLGVYGVLAFAVAQRTKEIGVRMALGAHARHVLSSVVGSGIKLALTGVAVGLVIALSAADVIRTFLFEIAPHDPVTYAGVIAGVLLVSAVAAYLPAKRAARVDPARVLNSE